MLIPKVALIQGASKGIGAAFTKRLLTLNPDTHVIATSRAPLADGSVLPELLEKYPNRLHVHSCNIWHEKEIEQTAALVKDQFQKLDLLVNSSGILNLEQAGETRLNACHEKSLLAAYRTNAMGPLLMAKHFQPLLVADPEKMLKQNKEIINSTVINISARVGSISDNKTGGWYAYRSSKAALNMITKSMAIELYRKNVLCLALHPGTVNTDFSRKYHKNSKHEIFDPEYVVECFLKIMNESSMKDSGSYMDYAGKSIAY